MSYKCAIFGHRYGEAEVEREREEGDSEVIIVERETETCVRCEHVRVVSENKEVTTVETAADIVADDLADESEHADETASPPGAGQPEPEPASIAEDIEQPSDPAEEDAVILDGEEEREPGEWPKEPSTEEGTADEKGTEEEDDEEPVESMRGDEDGAASWELPSDIDPHPETERPAVGSPGSALTVPEGEFYCPNCEFTTSVESTSLRAGDYCPECHRGALEHRSE